MGERPTRDQAKDYVKRIMKEVDPTVECEFGDDEEWIRRDVLPVWFRRGQIVTMEHIEITIEDVVFDPERHDQTKGKIKSAIASLGPKS